MATQGAFKAMVVEMERKSLRLLRGLVDILRHFQGKYLAELCGPGSFRDHSQRHAMPSRNLKHGRAIVNDQKISLHRDNVLMGNKVGIPQCSHLLECNHYGHAGS